MHSDIPIIDSMNALQRTPALDQGFPTCGTRTTGGTFRLSRWYAAWYAAACLFFLTQFLFYFSLMQLVHNN